MMAKVRGIVGLVVMMVCVVVVVVSTIIFTDRDKIHDAVMMARLSIDARALEAVTQAIQRKEPPMLMPEYQTLYHQLVRISNTFPVPAKWSYIASAGTSEDNVRLAVLTVDSRAGDDKTQPGYLYDVTPYPAMRDAVYASDDIIISTIVWDNDYKFLTRSGFAKIYNADGQTVGVLGVDLQTNHIVMQIVSMVMFSLAGVALVLLAGLGFAKGIGMLLTQAEYDKYIKGCR